MNVFKSITAVIAGGAALALSACAVYPVGGVVVSGPIGGGASTLDLTVYNAGFSTIYYVYVSPSNQMSWGPDVLGATNVLTPGESVTVFVPVYNTCFYDVRAQYANGAINDVFGINVCNNDTVTFR